MIRVPLDSGEVADLLTALIAGRPAGAFEAGQLEELAAWALDARWRAAILAGLLAGELIARPTEDGLRFERRAEVGQAAEAVFEIDVGRAAGEGD